MDDMENQAGESSGDSQTSQAAETPQVAASVAEEAPKKGSGGTVLALIFAIAAIGFAAYMLVFKDMDPISGKANALMGKSREEVIKALGPPNDEVETGKEFMNKYPLFRYDPEPPTGEEKVMVYLRGKWTIFLFLNYEGNLFIVHKAQQKVLDDEDENDQTSMRHIMRPALS